MNLLLDKDKKEAFSKSIAGSDMSFTELIDAIKDKKVDRLTGRKNGLSILTSGTETVDLGNNKTIPDYAFPYLKCKKLVMNKVTSVGQFAFASASFEEVEFKKIESIKDYAFQNNITLTKLVFPSSLTDIGYEAFQNCTALATVTFVSKPTKLENYIFNNCLSLTDIYVPWKVGELQANAFWGCSAVVHYESTTS